MTTQFLTENSYKLPIFQAKYTQKQGNRGNMGKIHVTRQFFEASGSPGVFFEKQKNSFLDKVNGSMCAKFQVYRFSFGQETWHT